MGITLYLCHPSKAWSLSLEDQFHGFSRSAHMDSLPPRNGDDPFSVAENPATASEENVLAAAYGRLDWNRPNDTSVSGNSGAGVLATAFNYRFPRKNFGFFFLSTLPMDRQAILDTGDPSMKRFVWDHFTREISYLPGFQWTSENGAHSVGLSLPLYFNARAAATLALDPADADARTQVFMAPSISYRLGYRYRNSNNEFSIFYRERQKAEAEIIFESDLPLLGTSYEIKGISDYLVAPRRIGASYSKFLEGWDLGMHVSWIQWSQVTSPFIRITESSPTLVTQNPSLHAHDRLFVSLGGRRHLSKTQSLSGGLGYRPGPFAKNSAFYSPNEYILGFSWHRAFEELGWALNVGLRAHLMPEKSFYTWLTVGLGFRL
jgi:hypothetical protein